MLLTIGNSVSECFVSFSRRDDAVKTSWSGNYTENVEGREDGAAGGSLCKGRDGVDALDIVSWPSEDCRQLL